MKNDRVPPVIFAECGCRLDLAGRKKYDATMCKFHERELSKKLMKLIIYGNPDQETDM